MKMGPRGGNLVDESEGGFWKWMKAEDQKLHNLQSPHGYTNGGLHIGSSRHAPNQRTCFDNCIGEVVQILRPMDKRYFGIIRRFDNNSRKHAIMFEDGCVEILDMSKEDWEFCNIVT